MELQRVGHVGAQQGWKMIRNKEAHSIMIIQSIHWLYTYSYVIYIYIYNVYNMYSLTIIASKNKKQMLKNSKPTIMRFVSIVFMTA